MVASALGSDREWRKLSADELETEGKFQKLAAVTSPLEISHQCWRRRQGKWRPSRRRWYGGQGRSRRRCRSPRLKAVAAAVRGDTVVGFGRRGSFSGSRSWRQRITVGIRVAVEVLENV